MPSTLSNHKKKVQPTYSENSFEKLISKLYALREKLVTLYYGKAECPKYSKARAFTIHLNATMYETNKMVSPTEPPIQAALLSKKNNAEQYAQKQTQISEEAYEHINVKIQQLEKELAALIS